MKKIFDNPYKFSIFIGLIFIIGMVLGSVSYTIFLAQKNKPEASNTKIETNLYPLLEIIEEERETSKDANLINVLLMGHGGTGHSGGGLMDAIILVSVNTTDKKAVLVSIPRDLWFSGRKINADPSIKDAVADITGLSVQNYISIDFNSFVSMIDSLGGVTVDAKKAYIDNFYPVRGKENDLCGFSNEKVADLHSRYSGFELEKQFTCRYETLNFQQGKQNMNGEMALKYVRSRHGDGDFGRSNRQFEVLKAILQKADVKNLKKAFDFVNTSFTYDLASQVLAEIGNPLDYAISYIGLSDQNVLQNSKSSQGAYILIPKSGVNIREFIKSRL